MKTLSKHIFGVLLIFGVLMPGWNIVAQSLTPEDSLSVAEYPKLLDLANRHAQEGNYRAAADYYALGFEAYKENYTAQMKLIERQMAEAYEVDKMERELEWLNQTVRLKNRQTAMIVMLIIVILAIIILLFLLYKYRLQMLRQQRRQNENANSLLRLEKEKQEVEAGLNALLADKYKRELMAETMLIEYRNKVLEEFRLFSKEHPALRNYKTDLERIMTLNQEEMERKSDSQQIHPVFYGRLQKYADNKLTPLDLQYCRMIYLKMTSKEMADILHVEPATVRINKYRLKQKLGIKKEDDLMSFIEKMA